jgi:hypothetical protein
MSPMAVLASDDFNRANGGLGANWATITGTVAPQIVGNLVQDGSAGNESAARYSAISWPADQYSSIKIIMDNSKLVECSPAIRCSSSAFNMYIGIVQGPLGSAAKLFIVKKIAGAGTILASGTFTVNANDILKLMVSGNVLTLLLNDVIKLNIRDSSITSGDAGLRFWVDSSKAVTDAQLDDWKGGCIFIPADYSNFPKRILATLSSFGGHT